MLQLITAEYLYKYRPAANEGELTQTRSAMVNTNTLASLSEELGVGEHLYLGKGIAKGGGRSLRSLLANAFEAILGAVFLDAGYDAAYHYYLDRFRRLPEPVKDENHKGRLQQVVQERYNQTPFYDSAGARGSGQEREYTAVVFAGAEALGTGHGPTKQEAEQDAARQALVRLVGSPRGEAAPARSRAPREASPRPRRSRAAAKPAEPPAVTEAPETPPPAETPAPVAAAVEAVTPSEVAEVLVEEEAVVEAIQPDLALPGAAPAAPRPRRRRSPARAQAAAVEPLPDSPTGTGPEAAPDEPAPAPAAPRRRRSSPRRSSATPAPEDSGGDAGRPVAPEPPPPPAPAPEAPRSRQFGQPLDE